MSCMVKEGRLLAEIGRNFFLAIFTEERRFYARKKGVLVFQNKSPIENPVVELLTQEADELP